MREAMRARTALAALLLASVVLVLLDLREGGPIGGIRGFAAAVVGPIERAAGAVASPFVNFAESVSSFSDGETRANQAAADLRDLAGSEEARRLIEAERQQVDDVLRAAGLAEYRVVPARVVAYSSLQRFTSAVTVDVGSSSGLATDMAVVTGAGLVGRVVSVGPNTATVELISDARSVVGIRAGDALQAGALRGTGAPGELSLQLLDITAALREGDQVMTFGSPGGRPYPPGVPVGTVVGFRGDPGQADRVALVEPAARLTALDIVGVIVEAPPTNVRPGVTPPKPSPTPSGGGKSPAASPPPVGVEP